MLIKNASFLTSVADGGKLPDFGVPEIAFAGKSNVGKSSFINFLTNNGKLARTSGDPGRTRLLNYFSVNGGELVFVDLPGYGFAKVAKTEKAKWGAMIEGYLKNSPRLKNVFVLLDVRHEPTEDDKMLLDFLYHPRADGRGARPHRKCGGRGRAECLHGVRAQKDGQRGDSRSVGQHPHPRGARRRDAVNLARTVAQVPHDSDKAELQPEKRGGNPQRRVA